VALKIKYATCMPETQEITSGNAAKVEALRYISLDFTRRA